MPRLLRAGAKGYLLKDCDEKDLLDAVRAVSVGKGWLSPEVSDAVLDDYRKHVTNPIDLLSPREREVLQMIAESKTNKEIATALSLSVYTVEAHRGRIGASASALGGLAITIDLPAETSR